MFMRYKHKYVLGEDMTQFKMTTKRVLTLCAGLLCAGLATTSHAEEWTELNVVGNEFQLFYKPTSLHTVKKFTGSQYQQAWFKQVIVNDINANDNLTVGDYVLNLWRFDCAGHKTGLVKSLYYRQTGQYLSQTLTPYVFMSATIPDTAGEVMWTQVCNPSAMPVVAPQATAHSEAMPSTTTEVAPGTAVAVE